MTAPEIITFGCRLNTVESEVIRGHLAAHNAANQVVIHTCAVTGEAEQQARRAIRRVRRERPDARIIVTGCAAQIDPASWAALPGVHQVLGNAEKLLAASWAPGAASAITDIMTNPPAALSQTERPAGRTRAFVQIQQGCDHRCTFCIIPFGRGPSRSVPAGSVVTQIRAMVAAGWISPVTVPISPANRRSVNSPAVS
jgi:threonylcarbamoyladenosine tRNA methylthiotransferase MtaB